MGVYVMGVSRNIIKEHQGTFGGYRGLRFKEWGTRWGNLGVIKKKVISTNRKGIKSYQISFFKHLTILKQKYIYGKRYHKIF